MMLKIYGFDVSTPSNAVRMCANALGLSFEYVQVNLPEGEHRSDSFLAVNPIGKVPAIDDDGFRFSESVAIMKYLCRKHVSPLYPEDMTEQARVDQWCSFVSVHIHMAMGRVFFNQIVAPRLGLEVDERSMRDGREFLDRFLPIVEGQLDKSAYLAGDTLSIADLCCVNVLDPAEMIELDLAPYPKLSAWRKTLRGQDFYRKVHGDYGAAMMAAA